MQKLFFIISFSLYTLNSVFTQDDAAMMKAWTEFMTPGDMHKWMAKSEGTWNGIVNTYMDPSNPTKSQASARYKMVYNGLYQMGDFTGNMMGMPFEGHGIMAYDNAKKQFINTWIDNMGSGVIFMTGQLDPKTNILHLSGTQTDPMTKKDANIRQEIQFLDDNTQMITMYGPGMDGKEMKMMEMKMTKSE